MYKIKRVVQTSEIGREYVLRTFDLINMIQDVEGFHIDHLDKLSMESRDEGFAIVLNFRHIKINRLPNFKEELEIMTKTFNTTPFYGYRNTVIFDQNKMPLVESYCVGSFIKLDGMKPYRLSKDALDSIFDETPYEMAYVGRKIKFDDSHPTGETIKIEVQPSFIDYYQHLNNAYYVDFAVNLLPENFHYSSISCEYRFPYSKGEIIYLDLFKKSLGFFVRFSDAQGKVHALIEFKE